MLWRLLAAGTLAVLAHAQTRTQAEKAFDSGDYTEAARLFQKDFQESSRCGTLFGLGLAEYRLGKTDAALVAFQSSVRCDPNLAFSFLAMGEGYRERHNNKEALAAYLAALRIEPANSFALRGAASIYLEEKLPQKGVEVLEKLVQIQPADAQAHADLGAALMASGNPESAEKQFYAALSLKPGNASASLGLASLHLRNGEAERAIATLLPVVKLLPQAFEPHFLLGSAYNRLGRSAEAVSELETALRLGSQDSEVYYHLARAYGNLGKPDDRRRALAKFAEVTRKSKENTAVQRQALQLVEEAKNSVEAGDLPAAAQRLEQARELQPADDTLLFRLAGLDYDVQNYGPARNYAEEAISLAPTQWLYRYLLGLIEIKTGHWAQARQTLKMALQLNPSAPQVKAALNQVAQQESGPKNTVR